MIPIATLHELFLTCTGVCTDTRSVGPGSLFIALKGPNFNANSFAAEALSKGSRYAVVDDPAVVKDERYLLVPDGLKALQELARFHRRQFDIPVIGITGTNGKTTTKELAHAVLGTELATLATVGNLNNHIGVPLTLLQLTKAHRIALIEMGANKPGNIAELCSIAEPTHGLITNVGKAHLEGFGSFDGVVRTKCELYTAVRDRRGMVFVPMDDPLLMERSRDKERYTYGQDPQADSSGSAVVSGPFLNVVFSGTDAYIHHAGTHLVGTYNLPNAMAAVALGQYFGVPDDRIAAALAEYAPSNNRSQFTDTGHNHVVLDAYNANPTSMAAALENFAVLQSDWPKTVILGDMRELGPESAVEHRTIIALVERLGLDGLFVGTNFGEALEGTSFKHFEGAAEAVTELQNRPIRGHLVLVKGSRGIKLETLVPVL